MTFPLASASTPALTPTQWIPDVFTPVVNCGRGVTLNTRPIYAEVENEELYSSSFWCLHGVTRRLYFNSLELNILRKMCKVRIVGGGGSSPHTTAGYYPPSLPVPQHRSTHSWALSDGETRATILSLLAGLNSWQLYMFLQSKRQIKKLRHIK
jgi:hypothetical protein